MSQQSLTLKLSSELNLISDVTPSQRVLEVTIGAPGGGQRNERQPLNLALVLDRSGSMSGTKLAYVRRAAAHVLDQLDPQDRAALVVYDDHVDLLAPSTSMNADARTDLKNCVNQVKPGGMTNLSGGWLQGCQEVAMHENTATLNRVLLLTDGLANQGITDSEILFRHARELAARSVSTSTFGVGHGFNEHLLEGIANEGGGNFHFISNPEEIPAIFHREFTEMSTATARAVRLNFELPPQVDAQVLANWRTERTENSLVVHVGDLFAGRTQHIYIRLLLPPKQSDDDIRIQAHVIGRGEGEQTLEARAVFSYQYAKAEVVRMAAPLTDVLARFARVEMADVTTQALKLERAGETGKASHLVAAAMAQNERYMPEEDVALYRKVASEMQEGMDEPARKDRHNQAYLRKRGRE
jgi:Ca-activated chloride channel family protein